MSYTANLEKLAKKFPDLEIVKQGNKVYTYTHLNNRTNQVAKAFLDLGIKKEDKIGILLYNSPEYLEIMFGLQKIGVIPVPINTRYGTSELKYICENGDITGLVIDKEFIKKIRNFIDLSQLPIKNVIVVGGSVEEQFDGMLNYEEFIHNKDTSNPEIELTAGDIGLLLYTGGTTGYPKGAILTHDNLYNATYIVPKHGMKLVMENKLNANALIPKAGMTLKFLVPTPIYHVSGLMPVLTQVGIRNLMIFPEKHSFDPKEICQIIETEKITTLFMVPTQYSLWLNYPNLSKFDLRSLTVIASGGAKLPIDMKIQILEMFPTVTLIDGYGSTETIGTSTVAFMVHDDIPKIQKGYIGQVVTGVKMKVVDELGEEVPIGEVGEMLYQGDTIMRGYYKDDHKTNITIDEDGWLHSGDLCKIDAQGNVYYVGRISETITSGGEKIYPMEIEELLRAHPKIYDAAVAGTPDDVWGQIIVAFIELEPKKNMTEDEVIEFCKDKIASYKKPRIIKFVKNIPLTKSGKMNRVRIREMAQSLKSN